MKKYAILIILLIQCLAVLSQDKQEPKVAATIEKLRKAMVDADKSTLEDIVSPKLSYGHSNGNIDNKKVFIENLVNGSSDFVTMDISEQTILISKKIAVVRHLLKGKTNDGGKPGEVNLRILMIFQKDGGGWKLLARQAVRMV